MIEIKNLHKTYLDKIKALKGIDLKIEDGDIYGIIGTSGAGKSTLVRCINLLETPDSGNIIIDGVDITKLNRKQLQEMRKNIAMIFQHFNLLMQKNVLENVCFPLYLSGMGKQEAHKRALELLEIVGLTEKKDSYPAQLSGGQKQRVAIARALATNPKVLLCDEATSALDTQTTSSILQLLKEINEKTKITIIIITHQMSVVESICNNVAIVSKGVIVEQGKVVDVFVQPKTQAAKELVFPEGCTDALIASRENERFIRVIFNGANTTREPVIASMAKEKGIVANIAYASTRSINGKVYGSMLLGVIDEKMGEAIECLTAIENVSAMEVTINE